MTLTRLARHPARLAVVAWGMLCTPAVAATLEVPADFATIPAAIAAAAPGDQVVVAPGTYLLAVDFLGKAIHLRSAAGPDVTLIEVIGTSVVRFASGEGPASVIEGFTITGGAGTPLPGLGSVGGGLFVNGASPTIVDCVVAKNSATRGGGLYVGAGGAPTLVGCRFEDNMADIRGGAAYVGSSSPEFLACTFEQNLGGSGGAIWNTFSSPTIVDCTFHANSAIAFDGGALANWSGSSPLVRSCVFTANAAGSCSAAGGWGGAIYNLDASSPQVIDCVFLDNRADAGGAVANHNLGEPLYVNCLFAGNCATQGGALFDHSDGMPTLVNCTLVRNSASVTGGAIRRLNNAFGPGQVLNCVIADNSPQQIALTNSTPLTAKHTLVQGGWPGEANIDADPLFVDADGPDGDPETIADNDYRLASGSPAIDAGDNALAVGGVTTDLLGEPRFVDDPAAPDCPQSPGGCGAAPVIDMGAHEFQPAPRQGDLDGNGTIDGKDLGLLLAAWGSCNGPPCPADLTGDGAVDAADLGLLLAGW